MWARRKLLFASIVFRALYVAAQTEQELDMAPDAVDYNYAGCHEKDTERFIAPDLLQEELKRNEDFNRSWTVNSQCSKKNPEDAAAAVYVNGGFLKKFNEAVKTNGVNVSTYENDFHFKALHFLLMAKMLLYDPENCKTVYVFPHDNFKAKVGSQVRLGRFVAANPDFSSEVDQDPEGGVILNITTCYYAKLSDNICLTESDPRLLLSPAEVFTVENVTTKTLDDTSYTEILLKHSAVKARKYCNTLSQSPSDIPTQWLVLVLAASSLFAL